MERKSPWKGGMCQVPMWVLGVPAGHCGEIAYGPQYPSDYLLGKRNWRRDQISYCFGPCCPAHGGPEKDEPIIFADGLTPEGRRMWCAVFPDFENLQESPAGFSGNPMEAVRLLLASPTPHHRSEG